MKPSIPLLFLLALAASSCDKARSLADKARSAVESEIAKTSAESGDTTPDPELLKLVDRSPEGYHFRKDLPFPNRLDVKTTRRLEISARISESSALGSSANILKGTQTSVNRVERAGEQVRHTLMESTFTEPVADGANEKKPVVRQLSPPSNPRTFRKAGGKWMSDDSEGFRAAALSKQLAPVFEQLLVENSLAPRSQWFGKHRIKIGSSVPVKGDTLSMLVGGNAKGGLTLTLESIAAVHGHPCGVFTVTGDYSRKKFPDFEGNLTDEDVTIQSGKVWLSLLHPLVLREELDTIQTFRSGTAGNPASLGQGSVKVSVIREWKTPAP
jgi:hypothetical protein